MQPGPSRRQNPYPADHPASEVWETGYTHHGLGKKEVPIAYRGQQGLEAVWLEGWYSAKRDAEGSPK